MKSPASSLPHAQWRSHVVSLSPARTNGFQTPAEHLGLKLPGLGAGRVPWAGMQVSPGCIFRGPAARSVQRNGPPPSLGYRSPCCVSIAALTDDNTAMPAAGLRVSAPLQGGGAGAPISFPVAQWLLGNGADVRGWPTRGGR